VLDEMDLQLNEIAIHALNKGKSRKYKQKILVPLGVQRGRYFIIAKVFTGDASYGNNVKASAKKIKIF
jgi:hypothetical protein